MLLFCTLIFIGFFMTVRNSDIVYLKNERTFLVNNESRPCEKNEFYREIYIPLTRDSGGDYYQSDCLPGSTLLIYGDDTYVQFKFYPEKNNSEVNFAVFKYAGTIGSCSGYYIEEWNLTLGKCDKFDENTFQSSTYSMLYVVSEVPTDIIHPLDEGDYVVFQLFSDDSCQDLEAETWERVRSGSYSFTMEGQSTISQDLSYSCNKTHFTMFTPLSGDLDPSHTIVSSTNRQNSALWCNTFYTYNNSFSMTCKKFEEMKQLRDVATKFTVQTHHWGDTCGGEMKFESITMSDFCAESCEIMKIKQWKSEYSGCSQSNRIIPSRSLSSSQHYSSSSGRSSWYLVEVFDILEPGAPHCPGSKPIYATIQNRGCQNNTYVGHEGLYSTSWSGVDDLSDTSLFDPSRTIVLPTSSECSKDEVAEENVEEKLKQIYGGDYLDVVGIYRNNQCFGSVELRYPYEIEGSGFCVAKNVEKRPQLAFYVVPDSEYCYAEGKSSVIVEGRVCASVEEVSLVWKVFGYENGNQIFTARPVFCDGKPYFDDTVCSSHGSCVLNDVCKCSSMYYGENCSQTMLFLYIGIFVPVGVSVLCCCCLVVLCCFFLTFVVCLLIVISQSVRSKRTNSILTNHIEWKKRQFVIEMEESTPILQSHDDERSQKTTCFKNEVFKGDENGEGEIYISDRKTNRDHLVFTGQFKEGVKHGKGREYFHPQDSFQIQGGKIKQRNARPIIKFEGLFENGLRHGRGTEYLINRSKCLEGTWSRGQLSSIHSNFVNLPKIRISDFQIDAVKDLIGRGSEGDVFRCEYEGREVALKILHRIDSIDRFRSYDRKLMFVRSQQIWSKVSDHPSILNLIAWTDVVDDGRGRNSRDERIGYISELCQFSLDRGLEKGIFRDSKLMLRIIYEVAEGLKFLHQRSIMHRDLKIQNVLVDYMNKAKICDFEFSRYDDLDWRKGTADLSLIGTEICIAPEITQGKVYSKKCDSFSMGILVWSLLFQRIHPYENLTECGICKRSIFRKGLMYHVASCDLRPVMEKGSSGRENEEELWWVVEEIIKPCLERNPQSRPSFEEICEILKRV